MKKKITPIIISSLAAMSLTSCCMINMVKDSTRAIQCNRMAVEMSTQAIYCNIQAIEESNRAIERNKAKLDAINQSLDHIDVE